MSLSKGPFTIKFDDMVINYVTDITYVDGKLGVDILISDYDEANFLLDGLKVNRVYCVGSRTESIGATYHIKSYKTGIFIEDDYSVMKLRVICEVSRVQVGEVKPLPKFAVGGIVNCSKGGVIV